MCRNEAEIREKSVPELNKNNVKKHMPKNQKNTQTLTPKWVPKSEGISGVAPLGAALVAQTGFVIKKWASSASQVLPRIEKSSPSVKTRIKSRHFSEPSEMSLKVGPFRIQPQGFAMPQTQTAFPKSLSKYKRTLCTNQSERKQIFTILL